MELVVSQEGVPQEQLQPKRLQQEPLQLLTQQLQEYLLSRPSRLPFQVQCVLKRENLMVLAQHPPGEQLNPRQVFGELEQEIRCALTPDRVKQIFGCDRVPLESLAKLYLRQLGQAQPYAFHSFKLAAGDRGSAAFAFSKSELSPADDLMNDRADDSADALLGDRPNDLTTDLLSDRPDELTDDLLNDLTDDLTDDLADWESRLALSCDEPELDLSLSPEISDTADETADTSATAERSPWLLWIVAGVGVSVASFAAGIYLVSRPCTVGQCEPLQSAQSLTQQATQTIQMAKSGQDLQQAEHQFNQADQLLKQVPPWSKQHGDAEALQKLNQSQADLLSQVIAAENKAEEANQKSRALPQAVQSWQDMQSIWRGAIDQLAMVPQGSVLYPFAQQRIATYRENLAMAGQYITAEQQAQKNLAAAKSTASIAKARQGVAQTIENWQQVQTTWLVAVNALKQVATTTTRFPEAQPLLTEYSSSLAAARDRTTREQLAQKSIQQASALARKATTLQQQNQWSQAVANWRSAMTLVERIPADTSYQAQAQTLSAAYTSSLQQAETQLKTAIAQQKLRNDLNQICTGSPRICTYLVLNDRIRIQFTPAYEAALRQAFTTGQSGNYAILGGAVNHVDSLQSALQAISNNSGLPIEAYNSSGSELMGSFNPGG